MEVLGVIGGSGVYQIGELRDGEDIDVDTPFGKPSAPIRRGTIGDTSLLFLPRHGKGHRFSPSNVPYCANIHALKQLGATHVLGLSAVGSLREDLPPRTLVLPDQIIDRTHARERTFFDRDIVAHVGLADPFCTSFRQAIATAARRIQQLVSPAGTYVCIEGPQFSTRAESNLFRSWGADIIGMTVMPEARLAREAGLCFATLAMVTDYDVWHDSEEDVSVEIVLSHVQANSIAATDILRQLALDGLPTDDCRCGSAIDGAIMTAPESVTDEAMERLRLVIGHRLDQH
jgi:5'-methylthioadenosine phosphorylase